MDFAPLKMHVDEVDTSTELVCSLVSQQFPQWSDLSIKQLASAGTDNAMFRLGNELVVRMPRVERAAAGLAREAHWLPILAPQLPCMIPQPLDVGEPSFGFPWNWSIYGWLDGTNPSDDEPRPNEIDLDRAADDIARFIGALHMIDTTGAPPAREVQRRGAPVRVTDRATRAAIASLTATHDTRRLGALWDAALAAPEWDRPPVWIHGDVLTGNLLFHDRRLRAVIDWGCACVGDPACDLMIAWSLFTGEHRAQFREAVAMDDATWTRAAGHAVSQAAMFIPYYRVTNPVGVARAERLLREVLADFDS